MLKIKIELELNEDQLRDIFESYDIKFTKKKVKEVQSELNDDIDYGVKEEFEELLEEIVGNRINEMYDK